MNFENTRLTVGVFSYNGAPKKLQISRENLIDGAWSYTKLGRLSKDEAVAVAPILMKAIETM